MAACLAASASSGGTVSNGPNLVKRCRPLLGTYVAIEVEDSTFPSEALQELVAQALDRISLVQSLMSFHDATSELSQLNARAHLGPLTVHPWTWEVLQESLRFSELSEGLFDVTVAPTLVEWGLLPSHAPAAPRECHATWRDIVLHRGNQVGFRQPLQIDLGGIAKGYAVDKAAEVLEAAGVARAVIDAGGDMRFVGSRPEAIAVRHPAAPRESAFSLPLTSPAVATSAGYFTGKTLGLWRRVNHLIHPRTRRAASDRRSATVQALTCLQADALTKIALLADPSLTQRCLQHEHATVALAEGRKRFTIFSR